MFSSGLLPSDDDKDDDVSAQAACCSICNWEFKGLTSLISFVYTQATILKTQSDQHALNNHSHEKDSVLNTKKNYTTLIGLTLTRIFIYSPLTVTGFQYDYPFLDESSGLTITPRNVIPLYKYMVNINQPSMVIMGLVVRACLVISLDAQVCCFSKTYVYLIQFSLDHVKKQLDLCESKRPTPYIFPFLLPTRCYGYTRCYGQNYRSNK